MENNDFKKFKEVFPGIELDDDISEYFDNVEVTEVELIKSTMTMYVHMVSTHLIARQNIKKAEEAVRLFVFGEDDGRVVLVDRYLLSGQYNLENLVRIYGDSILDELREKSAVELALIKMADKKIKDNLLTFEMVEGKMALERKADIEKFYNHLFASKFGMNVNTVVKLVKAESETEEEEEEVVKEVGEAPARVDVLKEMEKKLEEAYDADSNMVSITQDMIPKGSGESSANKKKDYNKDETGKMTIENLAFYLEQKNIKVKYNIISHRMEIEGFKSENQEQLVENAPALMEDDLKDLTGNTQTRIASYLNVLAARNDYNPILDTINSTVWDGKTRLNDLFKLLGIDTNTDENKYNRIFLRKWLMQCICGLHNDMKKPFSLDIVLVFKGKQGTGKTRLLEALTLDSRYFGDGVVLDVRNKDDIMQSLSKWICELGEISSTFKKDIDSLKAFISKSVDEFRVPYGKTAVQYPRMTSFCGTVNEDEFLIDRTGNRRFAVIPLQEDLYIDYDDIKNFDFLQLWAEINKCIENMVKNGKSYSEIFRLTRSEIQELERRNGVFIKPVPAQREIEDIFQMGDNYQGNYAIEWQYMTVAEFANHWNDYLKRYSVQQVGIALKALGIDTERVTINGDRKRLKKLPIRNFEKRITT